MRPTLKYVKQHEGVVAGVDEAGRGPLAGPVVAAAAILNIRKIPKGLNDSKQVTPEQREVLFSYLSQHAYTAVGIASVEEIDTHNIWGATKLAMHRAVASLPLNVDVALVDGNLCPGLACKTVTIVDGDAKCLAIAAASIVAKVTRDRIMRKLALDYPGYGWETNAGYGTKAHQHGLATLGVTPHHRRHFNRVKAILEDAL